MLNVCFCEKSRYYFLIVDKYSISAYFINNFPFAMFTKSKLSKLNARNSKIL